MRNALSLKSVACTTMKDTIIVWCHIICTCVRAPKSSLLEYHSQLCSTMIRCMMVLSSGHDFHCIGCWRTCHVGQNQMQRTSFLFQRLQTTAISSYIVHSLCLSTLALGHRPHPHHDGRKCRCMSMPTPTWPDPYAIQSSPSPHRRARPTNVSMRNCTLTPSCPSRCPSNRPGSRHSASPRPSSSASPSSSVQIVPSLLKQAQHRRPTSAPSVFLHSWLVSLGISKYSAGLLRADYHTMNDLRNHPSTDASLRNQCADTTHCAWRKLRSALSFLTPVAPLPNSNSLSYSLASAVLASDWAPG